MRVLLGLGMLAACGSAPAAPFEFAGLSRATTPQDVATRYPNSNLSGSYLRVAPQDVHDHVHGVELFGEGLSYRLRISFGDPQNRYPPCDAVRQAIVDRHGTPTRARDFFEEAMASRQLEWRLEGETVQLQCFKAGDGAYRAEAIAVHPK